MIKKFHELVLKDVILLDATRSANSLKNFWFIPAWICRKELEKLTGEIFKAIGSNPIESIQDQFDKVLAYQKLQLLDVLYKLVIIETSYKSKINAFKILLGKDIKESGQFDEIQAEVLKHTGIKLESPENVTDLRKYIEHKADKYREMFPEAEVSEDKAVKLEEVIYSVFNFMKEPYNPLMSLSMFCSMKEMAENRIKQQSKPEDNGEQ